MDDPTLLSWIERGQNIAALLVAIGVAAEFALGFMAGPARRRVDATREAEMIRLTTESAKASERAANAEKQAGSFQLQIAQANKGSSDALERAAKAEEGLGNAKKDAALALQRAADANRIAEEERLKRVQIEEGLKPRSLVQMDQWIADLSAFKGTEYMFSAVFADEESINLLKQLDAVLQRAGWKRLDSVGQFPSINIPLGSSQMSVQASLRTGVRIFVSSVETAQSLLSKPIAETPRYIQAAILLNASLPSHLAPPQNLTDGKNLVNVNPGGLTCVQIDVGKKP